MISILSLIILTSLTLSTISLSTPSKKHQYDIAQSSPNSIVSIFIVKQSLFNENDLITLRLPVLGSVILIATKSLLSKYRTSYLTI